MPSALACVAVAQRLCGTDGLLVECLRFKRLATTSDILIPFVVVCVRARVWTIWRRVLLWFPEYRIIVC